MVLPLKFKDFLLLIRFGFTAEETGEKERREEHKGIAQGAKSDDPDTAREVDRLTRQEADGSHKARMCDKN